jgi:hypothetical protein
VLLVLGWPPMWNLRTGVHTAALAAPSPVKDDAPELSRRYCAGVLAPGSVPKVWAVRVGVAGQVIVRRVVPWQWWGFAIVSQRRSGKKS